MKILQILDLEMDLEQAVAVVLHQVEAKGLALLEKVEYYMFLNFKNLKGIQNGN